MLFGIGLLNLVDISEPIGNLLKNHFHPPNKINLKISGNTIDTIDDIKIHEDDEHDYSLGLDDPNYIKKPLTIIW